MKKRVVKYVGSSNRKVAIIASLLGLLCLSIIGTHTYVSAKKDLVSAQKIQKELEPIIQDELKENASQTMDYVKKGRNKESQYYIFFSKKEDEKLVAQLEKQAKKVARSLENVPSAVLSYISDETVNEQLIHRKLVTKEYHWHVEKNTFSKEKEERTIAEILSIDSKKPVVLKDLVKDDASLRAITRVMQEKILDKHDRPETIIKDVLSLPDLTFDSDVTLFPQSLKINVEKDKTGFDSIHIEYTAISPYIESAFLEPAFIKEKKSEKVESEKKVALTFDDGPNATSTVRLLNLLEEESVEATFFLLGQMVTKHPEVAKKIVDQGHEIANHSYSHPDLTTLAGDEVKMEVTKADEAIFLATGVLPKTFRPPYGAVNQDVIKKVGLPIIQWDVDSLDWKLRDPNGISKKVTEETQNGSIILLHDIHDRSVEAVPKIIRHLKQEGYQFVTVSELLAYEPKPYHQYFGANNYLKSD